MIRPITIPDDLRETFEITEAIGAGGMGLVYRAVQLSLGRPVALKLLDPSHHEDPEIRDRFMVEARLASRLSHPNVVRVLDFGETRDGHLWIAYELVDGENLRQLLGRVRLTTNQVVGLARPMLRGLMAIHREGILHRDLKPENFMVTPQGTVKITDFGVARHVSDHVMRTRIGTVVGTPAYISPEQADGAPATPQSDVYSMAICFYELITGTPPFIGETVSEILDGHLFRDPPSMKPRKGGLPAGLEKVLFKALDKEPEFRHASAEEFLRALEPFHATPLDGAAAPGSTSGARRRPRSGSLPGERERSPGPMEGYEPEARAARPGAGSGAHATPDRPARPSPPPPARPRPLLPGKGLSVPAPPPPPGVAVHPLIQTFIGGSLALGVLTLALLVVRPRTPAPPPTATVSTRPGSGTGQAIHPAASTVPPDPGEIARRAMTQRGHAAVARGHAALARGLGDEARTHYLDAMHAGRELGLDGGGLDILQWTLDGAIHLGPPWESDLVGPLLEGAGRALQANPRYWLLWGLYAHGFHENGPRQRRIIAAALARLGEVRPGPPLEVRARLERLLATATPLSAAETRDPDQSLPSARARELLALHLLRWTAGECLAARSGETREQGALALVELAAHLARRADGFQAADTLARARSSSTTLPEEARRRVGRALDQVSPMTDAIRSRLAPDLPLAAAPVEADPELQGALGTLQADLDRARSDLAAGRRSRALGILTTIWGRLVPSLEPGAGPVPLGRLSRRDSLVRTLTALVELAAGSLTGGSEGLVATSLLARIEAHLTGIRTEVDNQPGFWILRSALAVPGRRFPDAEESALVALELQGRLAEPDRAETGAALGFLVSVLDRWTEAAGRSSLARREPEWVKMLAHTALILASHQLVTTRDHDRTDPGQVEDRLRTRLARAAMFALLESPERLDLERTEYGKESARGKLLLDASTRELLERLEADRFPLPPVPAP